MSQDSDSLPLRARATIRKAIDMSESDDDELPDWIKAHKSPADQQKPKPATPSSEDEPDADKSTAQGENKHAMAVPCPDGPSTSRDVQHGQHAVKCDVRDVKPAVVRAHVKASQPEPGGPASDLKSLTQPTQQEGTQQEGAPAAVAAVPGEVPVMLPEKVLKTKVLLELCGSDEAPATDLAGDAGAVGRMIVSNKPGAEDAMQIDLKGVLYDATVLPFAGTAMVVNIGPLEAKVETLVHDFVRLKEESSFFGSETMVEGNVRDLLDGSDDENYLIADEAGGEGQGGAAAPAGKPAKSAKSKAPAAAKRGGKAGGGASKPAARKPAGKKGTGKKAGAGKEFGVKKTVMKKTAGGGAKKAAAAKGGKSEKGKKGEKGEKGAGTSAAKKKTPKKSRKQSESEEESEFSEADDESEGDDDDESYGDD